MTAVTYTSKPGLLARDYTATVGQYRVVIEKMATDYMPWCVFIVKFDGPTYIGSSTVTTVLHTDVRTLAEAKADVERFLAAEVDARMSN